MNKEIYFRHRFLVLTLLEISSSFDGAEEVNVLSCNASPSVLSLTGSPTGVRCVKKCHCVATRFFLFPLWRYFSALHLAGASTSIKPRYRASCSRQSAWSGAFAVVPGAGNLPSRQGGAAARQFSSKVGTIGLAVLEEWPRDKLIEQVGSLAEFLGHTDYSEILQCK